MIQVIELSKVYGPRPEAALALRRQGEGKAAIKRQTGSVVGLFNVNFELAAGEFFCIMGLSGSGKSTLLRCINRLIEPTGGRILFKGPDGECDITALSGKALRQLRRRQISMVFQHFGLFPHRTVRDNVAYGLEVQGRSRQARLEAAERALALVGLEGWGEARPSELSGGMQQRVGLARALATEAPVLLMDEPFSALDPLIKVNMQSELLRLQQELKRTILFITHDLDEALRLGDRIAIMEDGEVVQIGTPEEIIVNPHTEYVANFVEHADPTGVITAQTVAQSLDSALFREIGRDGAVVWYARQGSPEVEFGWAPEGDFVALRWRGQPVRLMPLAELLAQPLPPVRRTDIAPVCDSSVTLRELMRARTISRLPALVMRERALLGIIDERELVHGILERRAYRPEVPAIKGAA